MPNVAKLTITRGLPGSGKTTWARTQAGAVRVNRDELRRMLHGGGQVGDTLAESRVTTAQRAAIEALLRGGVNVIADDTNLRARVVHELARVAHRAHAAVEVVDFTDVSLDTCIERDAQRPPGERVGAAVIRRMHAQGAEPLDLPEPPSRPDAILVDLDGTVALMGHRSPYDLARLHRDQPNQPVIRAVRAMYETGHTIIYCTGRTDDGRDATVAWLDEHVGVPYAGLYMRVKGDSRRDSVVKREIFERELRHAWHITAVFEDRDHVVKMWRKVGLTVFQVADGDF